MSKIDRNSIQLVLQKQLTAAFKKFDTDNTGLLERNQFYPFFRKIIEQFGVQQPTNQEIQQIWDQLDVNGDGKLSKKQFQLFIKDIVQIALEQNSFHRKSLKNQNQQF